MNHDYSGEEEVPAPDQLQLLGALVDKLGGAEAEVERLELMLKEAEAAARNLRETDIPELMQSIGLKELVTESGLKVKLREEVRVSFFSKEPEKREPAYAWLAANHHDGLIKNKVEMQFGKEQGELAEQVMTYLRLFGTPLNVTRKKEINHMTLVAFLKEQIREGLEVPLPLFNGYIQKFAKVDR